MKAIPLSQGKSAMVDDADFDRVNAFTWYAQRSHRTWYAVHATPTDANGKQSKILMHRFILDAPSGIQIDHRDHNGLNNIRDNMRFATHSENARNCRPCGKSKYLGVSWDKNACKWRAAINANDFRKHLGSFTNESDAGHAYDIAAIELFGEFANLNFKNISAIDRLRYVESGRCRKSKSSRFLGVHWNKKWKKWIAQSCVNGKAKFLGSFTNESDAALARYIGCQNDFQPTRTQCDK